MRRFLREVLTSALGYIVGSVLFVLILVAIISGSLKSIGEKDVVKVRDNSVLVLALSGSVAERLPRGFGPFDAEDDALDLNNALMALKEAKDDKRIRGLVLDCDMFMAGPASLNALKRAILDFKSSKKWVLAYGDAYTEQALALAAHADEIWLNPVGMVEWNGLASVQGFARDFLDRWGFEPVLFRVGKYKSAAENLTEKQLSPENEQQIKALIDQAWENILASVASGRKLNADSLDALAANLKVTTARQALQAKLVSRLAHRDELRAEVRKRLGLKDDDELRAVKTGEYAESLKPSDEGGQVAVLLAEGAIMYGDEGGNGINSRSFVRQLRELREDDDVKAIVLRINSPGGSALASDIIAREIDLTKKAKPVVASMGDVAASGGYYIAAPCDKIFAEPTTITGSIGVIGLLFNSQKFFNREIGFTFDEVYSHNTNSADLGNPNRPMRENERAHIQMMVDQIYEDFLERVRRDRKFSSRNDVHELAQGRVWTGTDARKAKLVDELGGLDAAIAHAAKAAGLGSGYHVQMYPENKSPFESFFEDMEKKKEDKILAHIVRPEMLQVLNLVRQHNDPRGIYSWLPISTTLR